MDRRTGWRDAWLPALLGCLGVAEMATLQVARWGLGSGVEVCACVLLVLRRRHGLIAPTGALVAVLVMPMLGIALDQPTVPITILALSAFSLARYVADLWGLAGLGLVLAEMFLDYHWFDSRHHNWSDVVFVLTLSAPPYVLGRVMRRLAVQKDALEQAQETIRSQAARAERQRIARELHDVVAHSVSAMVVQTAAAQDLVRTDPDRAEQVLADVAATGRRALADTGRLLHVVRDSDDELGLHPAPGLAQVGALVERFRADGLRVDLTLAERMPDLPAGVDVSAYRIVQEALTNALRYAADRSVELAVDAGPDGVSINAANRVAGAPGVGSGLGLVGVAERVTVLGGTLSHGVGADGRFELAARLPVAP